MSSEEHEKFEDKEREDKEREDNLRALLLQEEAEEEAILMALASASLMMTLNS